MVILYYIGVNERTKHSSTLQSPIMMQDFILLKNKKKREQGKGVSKVSTPLGSSHPCVYTLSMDGGYNDLL